MAFDHRQRHRQPHGHYHRPDWWFVGGQRGLPADTLVAGDVYKVQSSLGPRWQANARWCANLAILNTLRQFETTNGALVFPSLQNDTPTLLGRPVHELSNMDSTLGGGAGNNPVLVYGDLPEFRCVRSGSAARWS